MRPFLASPRNKRAAHISADYRRGRMAMREGEKMYTPHQRQLLLFSSIRGRCVGVLLLPRDKPHVFRASNVTGVISGDDIRVRRSVIETQPSALILSNPPSSLIWLTSPNVAAFRSLILGIRVSNPIPSGLYLRQRSRYLPSCTLQCTHFCSFCLCFLF